MWEFTAKTEPIKIYPEAFFLESYKPGSYVEVLDPFGVDCHVRCKERVQLHWFAGGCSGSRPLLVENLSFSTSSGLGTFFWNVVAAYARVSSGRLTTCPGSAQCVWPGWGRVRRYGTSSTLQAGQISAKHTVLEACPALSETGPGPHARGPRGRLRSPQSWEEAGGYTRELRSPLPPVSAGLVSDSAMACSP